MQRASAASPTLSCWRDERRLVGSGRSRANSSGHRARHATSRDTAMVQLTEETRNKRVWKRSSPDGEPPSADLMTRAKTRAAGLTILCHDPLPTACGAANFA
jgi:hypothetical protein